MWRANASTGLIGTNTIGKVVIGGAESVGTVVTHPGTTGTGTDLETDTVVRFRGDYVAGIGGGGKNGGKSG